MYNASRIWFVLHYDNPTKSDLVKTGDYVPSLIILFLKIGYANFYHDLNDFVQLKPAYRFPRADNSATLADSYRVFLFPASPKLIAAIVVKAACLWNSASMCCHMDKWRRLLSLMDLLVSNHLNQRRKALRNPCVQLSIDIRAV